MWRKLLSWLTRVGTDALVIFSSAALITGLWYVLFIIRPI